MALPLEINLIPAPLWGLNLRKFLEPEAWRQTSKAIRDAANGRCTICGAETDRLEAHEEWAFALNGDRGKATLVGINARCRDCHAVKHAGRTQIAGNLESALRHSAKVNGIPLEEARRLCVAASQTWRWLSETRDWDFDIDWFDKRFLRDGRPRLPRR